MDTEVTECVHHYVLPSLGQIVLGVCRKCGHEKLHLNTLEDNGQWPAPTQANGRAQSKKVRHAAKLNSQPRELYVR